MSSGNAMNDHIAGAMVCDDWQSLIKIAVVTRVSKMPLSRVIAIISLIVVPRIIIAVALGYFKVRNE